MMDVSAALMADGRPRRRLSHAKVRSMTHLNLPSLRLLSTPRCPMRGLISRRWQARRQRAWSQPLSACSLFGCRGASDPTRPLPANRAACASTSPQRNRPAICAEPQPIPDGSISQGMPERGTNRMPVSAARFGTGGRPPLGFGGSGGSSDSTINQNLSDTSGVAVPLQIGPDLLCIEVLKATVNPRRFRWPRAIQF